MQCGVEINPKLRVVKVWSAGSDYSWLVKDIVTALFGRRPLFALKSFGDMNVDEARDEMKHVAYKHNLRLEVDDGKNHMNIRAWPTPFTVPDKHLSGHSFRQTMAVAKANMVVVALESGLDHEFELYEDPPFEWEAADKENLLCMSDRDQAILDKLHGSSRDLHYMENWQGKKVQRERRRLEGKLPGRHLAEMRVELATRPATKAQIRRKKIKDFSLERIGGRVLKERQCNEGVGGETAF